MLKIAPTPQRSIEDQLLKKLLRLAPPLGAAAVAVAISIFVPVPGPLLLALLFGAVVANSRWGHQQFRTDQAPVTKTLLRLGVVMLGLKLPLDKIVALGPKGAVVIVSTVVVTFFATKWIGRKLGMEPRLVTLIASGFSICGAAAIAAVSDVLRASERDVARAVAMVTIFGSLMIGFVPWASSVLNLTASQSAVWAGASIHEVAQVAAAASILGGNAVAFAMLIKLGRVAMLAPVCWMVGRGEGGAQQGPALPWFIIGFAAMSVIGTFVPLPAFALSGAATVTNVLLAAGMFGLGLGLVFRDLWPLPGKLMALATASTVVALGSSLALLITLY